MRADDFPALNDTTDHPDPPHPVETTVRTYLEGTLVVDLFDAATKRLVWRGVATDTVSDNPARNAERVDKSIEKMFGKKFLEE